MSGLLRRRWTLAPLAVPSSDCQAPADITFRVPERRDDPDLASLLHVAYRGTIDDEVGADLHEELRRWREVDDADVAASALALEQGGLVGASLIARELGSPLLYEIAVAPTHRRCCLARTLLQRSIDRLALAGAPALSAWVTVGNVGSEALLASLGFVRVTRRLDQASALPHFRAARILATLSQPLVAAATTVDADGATLWLIGEHPAPVDRVLVAGTPVCIRALAPDAPEVVAVASAGLPLRGVDWLLARRRGLSSDRPAPVLG